MDYTTLGIYWDRKLYDKNKDASIDEYNLNKKMAIAQYDNIESLSGRSNDWDEHANDLEDWANNNKKYLSGRQLYEIGINVESSRDTSMNYWKRRPEALVIL